MENNMSILKTQEKFKNSLSKEGERFLLFPSPCTKAEKKVSLKRAAYQLSPLRSASQCLTPVALPLKVKTVFSPHISFQPERNALSRYIKEAGRTI